MASPTKAPPLQFATLALALACAPAAATAADFRGQWSAAMGRCP